MKRVIAYVIGIIFTIIPQIIVPTCALSAQGAETATEFSLDDLQGLSHRLSDYRGKVVVINFWASWCSECVEEISSINALYEKYREKGLVVIGISTDRKREPVEAVIKRAHARYLILMDATGGLLLKRYRVIGLPSTVIIDKKGFISARVIGRTDLNSPVFGKRIESLIDSGIKQ